MANIVRIKRRAAGGAAGAPSSLQNAELAFNEQDLTLYYGLGTGGVGGSATSVIAIGGAGSFVNLSGTQTISGSKTFSSLISGSIDGNAGTATRLQTPRTINGISFDGTGNITITANTPNTLTAGSYLTGGTFNGGSAATFAVDATSVNSASKVVARDASGNFSANIITAALSGNASTASTLQNSRSITATGDASWSVNFDGSANVTAALTLATVNLNVGTFTKLTVNGKGLVTAASQATHNDIAAPTADVSWGGFKLTNLADPVAAQDAATKQYVDSVAQGLDAKQSVKAATTANITLSGTQTIDGVAVIAGDRVLVKNQSVSSQNGLYVVAAGAWTRASDMDSWAEVPNSFVFVEEGTTQADTSWVCSSNQGGTLGSTAIVWAQFGAASSYAAGNGLQLTGNVFSVLGTTNRISVSGSGVDIAATYVGQTSITTLGTITTGTWNGSTISVANGGTGATTLTGYLKGNGTSAFTASATIPNTDISGLGTMSTQAASNVAITGGSITNLTTFDGITIDGGTF